MREDLLIKIESAMMADNIGNEFFTYEEIEEMKQYCRSSWRKISQTHTKTFTHQDILVLIVLIVNLAKNWGESEESRFWVKIFFDVYEDSTIKINNQLYDEFESIFNKYNKTVFISLGGKRMIRETILCHSFAPKISIEAFIRLLWSWYMDKDILDEGNIDMTCAIVDYLSKKFASQSNELDSNEIFDGKTYLLRAAIKYMFIQDNALSIKLVGKTIKYFDEIWHNNRELTDNYYAIEVNRVVDKILLENNVRKSELHKKIFKEPVITDLSKIYAGYELTNDYEVEIFIPEIRVLNNDYSELKIDILSNETIIDTQYYDVVGNDLKKRIKRITIPLRTLVNNFKDIFDISLKLYFDYDLECVYDSEKTLYRSFILFKNTRELKGDCKPDDYIIAYPINIDIKKCTNCTISGNGSKYIAALTACDKQYVSHNGKVVFFNKNKQESNFIIAEKDIDSAKFIKNENEYSIYKKIKRIGLVIDKSFDLGKIVVIHNNCDVKKICDISLRDDVKNIDNIDLEKLRWNTNGVHELIFKEVTTGKVVGNYRFYVLPGMQLSFCNNYAFDKDNIEIKLSIFGEPHINAFYSNEYELVKTPFDNGEIVLTLPNIQWKIDDGEWRVDCLDKNLWKDNKFFHYNSTIEIKNNSYSLIKLFCNENEIKPNSDNKFNVGDVLLQNCKNEKNSIRLKIDDNAYELFTIFNTEKIISLDKDNISYLEDSLLINFEDIYIGADNSKFELEFIDEEEKSITINASIIDNIPLQIADGEYEVKIYLLKENFYQEEKVLLLQEDILLGNPDKFYFKDKRIIIDSCKSDKGKIRFNGCYLTNIVYLKEENNLSIYSAILYVPKYHSQKVEIEKKDNNSLRLYYVDEENLVPANINFDLKILTDNDVNYKNIFSCRSFYYKEEI